MPTSPRHVCVALVLFFALALRAAVPFAQEGSDLKADPEVRFGTLPNGVRYAVMPNHEPKGRASLRLLVLAGSLEETDDQRGLAHFLEHLAFNGSAHYPRGTLVEFFQRMGMSFGGDTNASTSFDHTVYQLELPKTDPATLAEGFRVFGDYAGGLLLEPAAIEKERGIILSEKRVNDSVGYRTFVAQYEFMLSNTLLPARIPIGQTPIIEGAQRDRFADFWNAWYRPEKMAVIVVGDVDAPAVEKMITGVFSALAARTPARPDPTLGSVAIFQGVRANFHPEPEAPATSISISSLTPYVHEPDNAATRLKYLPRDLALAMLNRRFSILAKKENALFVSASVTVTDEFQFVREASVDVECKPDQWSAALAVGEQELRRALEHGFQAAELREIASNFRNDLEQAVKTAPTRRSPELADTLAQSLLDREVFTSPADDLALFGPALEKITPADCTAALRTAFGAPGCYVMVAGNVKIPGDATATIAEAYAQSRAVSVAPAPEEESADWAYTDFGPPGKVVKREEVADLGITLITFSNGVRLNLKKTDFEADGLSVGVRVGNGMMTEPRNERGLSALSDAVFTGGGLAKHSSDDLRRILAGRNAEVRFGAANDAFEFTGGTTPEDLLLELQLIAAYLTDAGYRPESLRQAQKGIEQLYLSFEHTADGPLSTEIPNLLASGDPRFGLPAKDVIMARTLAEIRAWLTPQFTHGALEVAIVGDLQIDAAIDAVAKTLGALSPREKKPPLDALRRVSFPAQPFAKNYTIASEIPKGVVQIFWPTTDGLEIKRSRRLALLAEILNDRLRVKVREELGGTYSPSAGSAPSDTFIGYGYITANIDVDPPKAPQIERAVLATADDLATNGVGADELDRARQPLLTSVRESFRTNGYWLGVLMRAQEKPQVMDWSRSRLTDLEAITQAELNALAKIYLPSARAFRVIVLPSLPSKTSAAPFPAPERKALPAEASTSQPAPARSEASSPAVAPISPATKPDSPPVSAPASVEPKF